jgi:hypothetical protein
MHDEIDFFFNIWLSQKRKRVFSSFKLRNWKGWDLKDSTERCCYFYSNYISYRKKLLKRHNFFYFIKYFIIIILLLMLPHTESNREKSWEFSLSLIVTFLNGLFLLIFLFDSIFKFHLSWLSWNSSFTSVYSGKKWNFNCMFWKFIHIDTNWIIMIEVQILY